MFDEYGWLLTKSSEPAFFIQCDGHSQLHSPG